MPSRRTCGQRALLRKWQSPSRPGVLAPGRSGGLTHHGTVAHNAPATRTRPSTASRWAGRRRNGPVVLLERVRVPARAPAVAVPDRLRQRARSACAARRGVRAAPRSLHGEGRRERRRCSAAASTAAPRTALAGNARGARLRPAHDERPTSWADRVPHGAPSSAVTRRDVGSRSGGDLRRPLPLGAVTGRVRRTAQPATDSLASGAATGLGNSFRCQAVGTRCAG